MKSKISSNADDDLCNNSFVSLCNDFLFGFNDRRFSDRELIIEILADDDANHPQSGVEALHADDSSSCSQECSRVTRLHVSSILLAAKSPFFRNLFTNGMMESEQRCVTLRIHANEEAAFMEIVKYMYSGALTAQTAPGLVDVLKLADKFHVVSCIRLCASLLKKLPMSTKSALVYLDLTSNLSMDDEVQLLADEAKQFLAAQYKDIDRFWHEILQIPLPGVEAILSSDVLRVSSEDNLFRFVLTWAETHYPKLEDQRKILSPHLARYIRFPYMSLETLREVLSCEQLDHDFAYKAVVDALFFKITTPHHRHHRTKSAPEDSISTCHRPFVRRNYKLCPIKVVEFEFPCRELVVYVDLMFDECANLKPSGSIFSENFNIRGQPYFLCAQHLGDPQRCSYFCVSLRSYVAQRMPFVIEYEFAARSYSTKKFLVKCSGLHQRTDQTVVRLYKSTFPEFKAGKMLDSINGIIYLEVKIRYI